MREREDLIAEILDKNDIVEVVGERVLLQKRGKDYWGKCPFHAEKTASFSVSAEKQLFYCFGCQKGGNALTFVRLLDNLTQGEAVSRLAERAGIAIRSVDFSGAARVRSERERFLTLNQRAADFFARCLAEEESALPARTYLLDRGIPAEATARFSLGFAPAAWDRILVHLVREGFTPQELEHFGLIMARAKGSGYYDRFRNRIMFPIIETGNRVVGFGARALAGEEPKYLNSPENPYFEKKTLLYGLPWAISAIREKNQAILVEGYFDVLTCHLHGLTSAVATMGTALTSQQAAQLLRVAQEVVLILDSDEAGRNAALRASSLIRDLGGQVRLVLLPEGKDPDEFLRLRGAEALQQLIAAAPGYLVFRLQLMLANTDRTSMTAKIQVIHEIRRDYEKSDSPVEKQAAIAFLAQNLRLNEDLVRRELRVRESKASAGAATGFRAEQTRTVSKANNWSAAEGILLALMVESVEVRRNLLGKHGVSIFPSTAARSIAQAMIDQNTVKDASTKAAALLLEGLAEEIRNDFLQYLMQRPADHFLTPQQQEKAVADCLHRLNEQSRNQKMAYLYQEIVSAYADGDIERSRILQDERNQLERGE